MDVTGAAAAVPDGPSGGNRGVWLNRLGRTLSHIWFSAPPRPAGVSGASAPALAVSAGGHRRGTQGTPRGWIPHPGQCHPHQQLSHPEQTPPAPTAAESLPLLFLCSPYQGTALGLGISAMFLGTFGRAAWAGRGQGGADTHRWTPAEPALSPGSCADRSPAAREQPLLKLQPGRKQEPASAKHQLGARNSPGPGTRHFPSTNFPAHSSRSITARPCLGQGGRQRKPFFGAISATAVRGGGCPGPFPAQPNAPGGKHCTSPNLGSQWAV